MIKDIKRRKKRRGQTTLEYAILVIVIIGALITMQTYIKRALQGKFRESADQIGDAFSPGNTNVFIVSKSSSYTHEKNVHGAITTTLKADEISNTTTNIEIVNAQFEYWANPAYK